MHPISEGPIPGTRLTVLRRKDPDLFEKPKRKRWLVKCVCGREVAMLEYRLCNGAKSCGCSNRLKHGHTKGKESRTYNTWRCMLRRCYDPKHGAYPIYGGAGVAVHPDWMSFENFLRDMGERPPDTTLDRKEITGNYEPGNCRWMNATVQAENKKNTHWIVWREYRMTLSAWARFLGIPRASLYRRMQQQGEQAYLDSVFKQILKKPPPRSSDGTEMGMD
jgi:hypothetical protein